MELDSKAIRQLTTLLDELAKASEIRESASSFYSVKRLSCRNKICVSDIESQPNDPDLACIPYASVATTGLLFGTMNMHAKRLTPRFGHVSFSTAHSLLLYSDVWELYQYG